MPHTQMMADRLRFLNIDQNALSELREARDILEPAMDEMLDRFYLHLLREPDLQALFADEDAIDRARTAQKSHWLKTLFDGKYDEAHFEKTVQIGRAHARIGLTPNWYIGGYCQMFDQFIELISNKYTDTGKPAARIIQAVSKAIFLDMDLVIHSYLEAKDSTMLHILRKATDFKADVWTLSDEINDATTQIRATAETISAQAVGPPGTTSTRAGTPSESGGDTVERINELLAQAEQLSRQTMQLDARLKRMPLSDKLYIEDDIPKSGLIARLKAMVLGKK